MPAQKRVSEAQVRSLQYGMVHLLDTSEVFGTQFILLSVMGFGSESGISWPCSSGFHNTSVYEVCMMYKFLRWKSLACLRFEVEAERDPFYPVDFLYSCKEPSTHACALIPALGR